MRRGREDLTGRASDGQVPLATCPFCSRSPASCQMAILTDTMNETPEQLVTMVVFSDDIGFDLSYPVYDGVDPLTNRANWPPRVFTRPVLRSIQPCPAT